MTGTGKYEQLLKRCAELDPVPTAVAHPCEASALAGAIEAGEKKLITPILVGPAAKIRAVASDAKISLETMSKPGFELQWTTNPGNRPRGLNGLTQGVSANGDYSEKRVLPVRFVPLVPGR